MKFMGMWAGIRWGSGPFENPEDKWIPESRKETMRRICQFGKTDGLVSRDGFEHDLNQRNAEHYFFGNALGRTMGPGAPVSIILWDASKILRRVTGPETTRPTSLSAEMGQRGAADAWIYGRNIPEECSWPE